VKISVDQLKKIIKEESTLLNDQGDISGLVRQLTEAIIEKCQCSPEEADELHVSIENDLHDVVEEWLMMYKGNL
jgi:chorismate mutase